MRSTLSSTLTPRMIFVFAILVSDFGLLTNLTNNHKNQSHNILKPTRSAAVICQIGYSMHSSAVLQDFVSGSLSLRPLHPIPNIRNLTGMMLGEMIHASISDSGFKLDMPAYTGSPLFHILVETLKGEKSRERLFSVDDLQSPAIRVWAGVGAYFIREKYMKPASIETSATAIHVEDRLLVGAASLWLMLAGLGMAITFPLRIIFTTPQSVVPHDPALLSTDAMVLFSSPTLQTLLEHCHEIHTSEMNKHLRGVRFNTAVDKSFRIDATCDEAHQDVAKVKAKSGSWIPLPAKYYMICLILALPLAVIIALEVLHRISVTKDRFSDVSGSEDTAIHLSRYGSALVMLLVATCSNSLDFTAAVFASYSCLKSGLNPGSRGVCLQILGSLPPVALFRSVKSRHAGSFLSNLAGMIGSLLTTVASGLWVIDQAATVEQAATASLSSAWDIEWFNSSVSGDSGAGSAFDQIQHGSTSMPTSIFQDVVLPHITNLNSPWKAVPALDLQNSTMQVDGLRPVLSCEVVDDEHITIEFNDIRKSHQRDVDVLVFPSLPIGCQQADSDNGRYSFGSSYRFSGGNETNGVSETRYLGNFLDLHLGPLISSGPTGGAGDNGELSEWSTWTPDNPVGCPSIGAIFARISRYHVDHEDIVAVICSQQVQQVRVNVTYTGPNLTDPAISTRQRLRHFPISCSDIFAGRMG